MATYWDSCICLRRVYCCRTSFHFPPAMPRCHALMSDRGREYNQKHLKLISRKLDSEVSLWLLNQLTEKLAIDLRQFFLTVLYWMIECNKRALGRDIFCCCRGLCQIFLFSARYDPTEKSLRSVHIDFSLMKDTALLIQWWLTVTWQMKRFLSRCNRDSTEAWRGVDASHHQRFDSRLCTWLADRSPTGICKWDNTAAGVHCKRGFHFQ